MAAATAAVSGGGGGVLVIKSKEQVAQAAKINAAVLEKQLQNNSQFLDILGRHDPSLKGAFCGKCKQCGDAIETQVEAVEAHDAICPGARRPHD